MPARTNELSPDAAPAIAFSYLRSRSPAQSDGDSVRRQTALRESRLKRHSHIRLDDSLTLEDRGDHRTNSKHALAWSLDEVTRGRVPRRSYLIVESLTREQPAAAGNTHSAGGPRPDETGGWPGWSRPAGSQCYPGPPPALAARVRQSQDLTENCQ
jgi:hypothetical protein